MRVFAPDRHHQGSLSGLIIFFCYEPQLTHSHSHYVVLSTHQFTNQQIIDTYTAFINNWKNARHAIKVAIQAKPAFERFLEVSIDGWLWLDRETGTTSNPVRRYSMSALTFELLIQP